jgi:hypothetical protein
LTVFYQYFGPFSSFGCFLFTLFFCSRNLFIFFVVGLCFNSPSPVFHCVRNTDRPTQHILNFPAPYCMSCTLFLWYQDEKLFFHLRSSSANAAVAFAVATAGSSNPRDLPQVRKKLEFLACLSS